MNLSRCTHDAGRPRPKRSPCAGISMVEALLCVALLGILAVVATAGLQPAKSGASARSDVQSFDLARAKMEELRAAPAAVVTDRDTVQIGGRPLIRTWSSNLCDMNGDGLSETDAYQLHVDVGLVSLETIRTEPGGVGALK